MTPMRIIATVIALLLAAPAAADTDARRALEAFVRNVTTLEARFEQIQRDEFGDVLGESKGWFWLERPARFRWEVTEPFPQLVLSDGEHLWFYDPDIAQATRRPAGQALAGTPAALLANGTGLDDAYDIERLEDTGDGTRLQLVPHDADAEFRSLVLTLREDVPYALVFEDPLGGVTEVRFLDVRVNRAIDPELLRFVPPEDTDVVEVE